MRYCRYRTNSVEEAEDIMIEVFIRCLESRKKLEAGAARGRPVLPWLFRVASNLCCDSARKAGTAGQLVGRQAREILAADHQAETPRYLAGTQPIASAAPVDSALWSDSSLCEAVRELNEAQKLVVYLRIVEDRPFGEVAKVIGRSVPATKMIAGRALKTLRRKLKDQEMGGEDEPYAAPEVDRA